MAEMAILAPIYVALMTGAIYLAHIGLMKTGARKASGFAAAREDQQVFGDVEDLASFRGAVTVTNFDDTIDSEDMWAEDDISAVLEDIARAPIGYYEIVDGEIVYILDEDRLSAYGDYIFDNNLQDESDEVAEILGQWLYRSRATISCSYDPMFGDWDPVQINDIISSGHVKGDKDRGTHPLGPQEDPYFNTDILDMLSGDPMPAPIETDPALWISSPGT